MYIYVFTNIHIYMYIYTYMHILSYRAVHLLLGIMQDDPHVD